jgi:hypothetical protein
MFFEHIYLLDCSNSYPRCNFHTKAKYLLWSVVCSTLLLSRFFMYIWTPVLISMLFLLPMNHRIHLRSILRLWWMNSSLAQPRNSSLGLCRNPSIKEILWSLHELLFLQHSADQWAPFWSLQHSAGSMCSILVSAALCWPMSSILVYVGLCWPMSSSPVSAANCLPLSSMLISVVGYWLLSSDSIIYCTALCWSMNSFWSLQNSYDQSI